MAVDGAVDGAQFGAALRSEREHRGISLEHLCGETKVSPRHVFALEQGNFGALPRGVFRRGIVRAYVNALGLDEARWMTQFQACHDSFLRSAGEAPEAKIEGWEAFALNVKKNRSRPGRNMRIRWAGIVLLILSLASAALVVWRFVLVPRISY